MPSIVAIDGAIVPRDRAVVSVYDRGFLYGDTVFETLRTHRGVPFLLEQHLARLARSAALVGIVLPVPLEVLGEEVAAALAASAEPDAVVRITISRGEGPLGLDPSAANAPRRVLFIEPLGPAAAVAQERGIGVRLVATRRAADLVPAAKVGAYLEAVVALRAARGHGDDDAVVIDPSGLIVEATAANVFAVVLRPATHPGDLPRPTLVTPPEGELLPGITRSLVLRLAHEAGLGVAEERLPGADLAGAQEAFVTSSVRAIVPVLRVDGEPVGAGTPGPVTRLLQAAYRAVTEGGASSDRGNPPHS